MQKYTGLNPFLQSKNSPINQENYFPVTENYPVQNDSVQPQPVYIGGAPVIDSSPPVQNFIQFQSGYGLDSMFYDRGLINSIMIADQSIGTAKLDSETYGLLGGTTNAALETASYTQRVSVSAGTTEFRGRFRAVGGGTAEFLVLNLTAFMLVSATNTTNQIAVVSGAGTTTVTSNASAPSFGTTLGIVATATEDVVLTLTALGKNDAFPVSGYVANSFAERRLDGGSWTSIAGFSVAGHYY